MCQPTSEDIKQHYLPTYLRIIVRRTVRSVFGEQTLRPIKNGLYATEGAFLISAQLSTDGVNALRKVCVLANHTPSIAFRYLPPNSARIGYATKGALFISAQLSTYGVNALRKIWVLTIVSGSNIASSELRSCVKVEVDVLGSRP